MEGVVFNLADDPGSGLESSNNNDVRDTMIDRHERNSTSIAS